MTKAITTTATVNGVTFKRSSKTMAYTHAVVAAHSKAEALRRAAGSDWAKTDRSNFAYYLRTGDARVAGLTETDYLAQQRDRRVRHAELTDETPFVLSWSQSEANARKAAQKTAANAWYRLATVVPAGFNGTI